MNEKMNGGISTMRGIFCRLSFQKGGITAETIAAQGFDGGIFSVDTRHVGASFVSLAPTYLISRSALTPPDCDFGENGESGVGGHLFYKRKAAQSCPCWHEVPATRRGLLSQTGRFFASARDPFCRVPGRFRDGRENIERKPGDRPERTGARLLRPLEKAAGVFSGT